MKKAIILLVFSVFALAYFGVDAQSKKSDQLKKNKQKIEKEIKNKQKLLEETKKNKKASQQQLSVLRDQIATREVYMTELQNEINVLSDEIRENQNESSRLARKLTCLKEDYSRVVYNTFKNRRRRDPLLFILSSEDYSTMFRRMRFYAEYSQNVKKKVEEITASRNEIEHKCQELALIEGEKQTTMQEQENANNAQRQQKREVEQLSKKLNKKEAELKAEIKKKQQEQSRLANEIQKAINAEIAAANARNNQKSSAGKTSGKSGTSSSSSGGKSTTITLTPEEKQLSSSFAGNKGKLPWPVSACAKIQDFGKHPHPDAPSVMVNNIGIELLTHANAEVKAVFKGTVTTVKDFDGAKLIIIRHGEYLTIYKNITNVTIKVGQNVSTGQKIGNVAKKSDSGTYEFTFIINQGQNYLDPNLWLTRH
ncbi:MAG: peptidoglycan DD-metalloendopeptidase family protein [Bacteroidales bacterium]|nr:peptidoglycan DD-metalloendopeptidase family protein [Bacteroidales bacterium]